MFISHDLIRDIIGYINVADLWYLRNVSPIIDREICAIGRKVVLYRNECYDLVATRAVIIQFGSGKKEVLVFDKIVYKTIDNNWYVHPMPIIIEQYSGQVHEYIYIDKNNKMGVVYNRGTRHYYRFGSEHMMESAGKNVYYQTIKYKILGAINYIDFNTNCALQDTSIGWQYIERFTVIFKDGNWASPKK